MTRTLRQIGAYHFALFLVCLLVSSAQAKRLPVRLFTSADGLGSSFVNALASDSRGFMWFCTRDGLSRFDGARFITYQITEKDSPPGIEDIFEARDGSYWITTTGGLYRFDPTQLPQAPGETRNLGAEFITSIRGDIYQDREGNLWLGGAGLYLIQHKDDQYLPVAVDLGLDDDPIVGLAITDLVETDDGSFWINNTRGLLRMLPDGRRVFYPDEDRRASPSGSLRMIVDRAGRVWLARSNRLYVIKPDPIATLPLNESVIVKRLSPAAAYQLESGGPTPFPAMDGEVIEYQHSEYLASRFAKSMLQTSDETVWVTSEDRLLEFAHGKLRIHSSADGLPNVMGRLAEDNVGNLWIAGQSNLARLDRKGMVTYGSADGATSDRFLAMVEGPDGTMYFGNPEATLARFDGERFRTVRTKMDPTAAHLWTSRIANLDRNGDWWILTGKKLYRFSGIARFEDLEGRHPSATYGIDEGLRSDGVLQLFEDRAGSIWVSTRGNSPALNGLGRMRRGETLFTSFTEADGLPPEKSPSSFAEDAAGNIWITLVEGGVLRFDGVRFHDFGTPNGIDATGAATDLYFDSSGRLWVTSASAGVYRIDAPASEKPAVVRLSTDDGITSNNVRTVTEDKFGRIYFGTARGVDRLSPDTGSIKRYTIADGLPSDFVSDSFCDSRGDVWFATNSGVSRLVPVPDQRYAPPNVWLGGVRIAGVPRPTAEVGAIEMVTGDLSDSQNNLEIDFYGIDFRTGETLRYQYKLEGSNSDWSVPSESRSVTFANLQPADYRFLVRAVDSSGSVSPVPAVVAFRILPPVWQRWWFVLASAAVIATIIFLLYQYRIKSLRKINAALSEANLAEERLRRSQEERLAELEQVRSRIATDLHDDIGASLTQIAILSEVAQASVGKGNGSAAGPLARITDVSNELVETMSDIVWSINPAKDHLSDLVQRMRRFASDVFPPRGIRFTLSTSGSEHEIVVNTNIRREVFLIFKESVNNIAKHSRATQVAIELDITGSDLVFRISDNGIGFHAEEFRDAGSSSHGIFSIRRRASELGGELDIASKNGDGTSIRLRLPVERTLAG